MAIQPTVYELKIPEVEVDSDLAPGERSSYEAHVRVALVAGDSGGWRADLTVVTFAGSSVRAQGALVVGLRTLLAQLEG